MDPIPENPLRERRRAIFERACKRYAKIDVPLDDPVFLRLMEAWITGEIEMQEAKAHWNSVRISKVEERRTGASTFRPTPKDPLSEPVAIIESTAIEHD
jgi:hypothetical protein